MAWLQLAQLGLALYQGYRSYSAGKDAAAAGSAQGTYNASQALYFGQMNADATMEAAGINAEMTLAIGSLNAGYIERAGERNVKLYGIQTEEEMRRHVLAEKMNAGAIRAASSGTGAQVNTGTPLRYLNFQIDEGLNQRHFLAIKHYETKKSMIADYMDRAYVTREGASLQASAIMANGAIGAEMALAQSQMQYTQYMQAGAAAQTAGNQQSSNAMWGVIGAIGTYYIGTA